MPIFAAIVLAAALMLGVVLLSMAPRTTAARAAHGAAGACGAVLAGFAWLGAARPTSVFAADGVALALVALALGAGFWRFGGRMGQARGVVLALHGALGATGICLFAAWAFGG